MFVISNRARPERIYYDTKVLTSARIVFLHIGHAWKEEPHSWQKQKWPQGSKVRATGRWRHWRHVLRVFSRLFSALRARNLSSWRRLSNLALSSATPLSLLETRFRSHSSGRPEPEQGPACVGPWSAFWHVAFTWPGQSTPDADELVIAVTSVCADPGLTDVGPFAGSAAAAVIAATTGAGALLVLRKLIAVTATVSSVEASGTVGSLRLVDCDPDLAVLASTLLVRESPGEPPAVLFSPCWTRSESSWISPDTSKSRACTAAGIAAASSSSSDWWRGSKFVDPVGASAAKADCDITSSTRGEETLERRIASSTATNSSTALTWPCDDESLAVATSLRGQTAAAAPENSALVSSWR